MAHVAVVFSDLGNCSQADLVNLHCRTGDEIYLLTIRNDDESTSMETTSLAPGGILTSGFGCTTVH